MATGFDRRTLIGGAGALALVGCYPRRDEPKAEETPQPFLLNDLEERHGGRLGMAALDVGSQRRVSWRGQERFAFCSTFKAFLAVATLERVQREEEQLDRAVAVTRADMIPHAPVTEKAIGRTLTIRELMQAAVEVSDNPAANILIREMGGIAVWRSWWPTFGDTTTVISRLEPDLNTALPNDPRDTCLPDQTIANIRELAFSDRLTPEHDQLITGWMIGSPTGANRIKAGAPQGWTVAHKTGTGSNGATNDIGMLTPLSGSPVLMAAYFTGAPEATDDQRDAVIAEATRRALKALGRD
ncbi:class A beta-lactamase [Brevundimonas intermedia]|uniref:beta-lactamase n=1 Tax=Brevundimonas intermedia TaxID=74315 RepID=A0A4Y9RTT6_9CAUL|nr:class A beta-lactamase [Brevundimonas intermedia]TFW12540.1 class A beta-lactamase [Brevundimonas intermedia]